MYIYEIHTYQTYRQFSDFTTSVGRAQRAPTSIFGNISVMKNKHAKQPLSISYRPYGCKLWRPWKDISQMFLKGNTPDSSIISLGKCVTLGYVGIMGISDFPFQWPPPVIPPYQRPPCMQSFHSSTAGWLYNPRMKWFPSLGNKWTPGSTSKWTAQEASEPVTSYAFTA